MMLSHQESTTAKPLQDGTIWDHLISQGDKWLAIGKNERNQTGCGFLGKGNSSIGKLVSAAGWQYQTSLLPMLSPVREQAWLPYGPTDGEVRYGLANKADFASCPNTRQMLIDRLVWIPAVCSPHMRRRTACGSFITMSLTPSIWSFYTLGRTDDEHARARMGPAELISLVCIAAHVATSVMLSAGTHLLRIKNGIVINQSELAGSILRLEVTQTRAAGGISPAP
ncbi:MAG: hypothetical protein R3F31_18435 [Verrucomicrobiales bacterium]